MSSALWRPARPRNMRRALAAGALLVALFAVGSWLGPWSPKRGAGLAAGVLAAAILCFESLYPFRRPRARPFRTAASWYQAHVYAGAVALVAILIHAGTPWPHGFVGRGLLLLSLWTALSGLVGVLLQKWVPARLSAGLRVEALYERIPVLVDQLRAEADALAAGAGPALQAFHRSHVRPALAAPERSRAFLRDVRAGQQAARDAFARAEREVPAEERRTLDDLLAIRLEKLELDAHYSLQRLLRDWLALHLPAVGLLMGLLAVHVAEWLWY